MANEHLSIEIEKEHEVIRYLDAVHDRAKRWARGLVAGMANYTLYWIEFYAPEGETRYLLRHADATGVRFHPGGAGGGGEYVAVAGVKRGDSNHPLYVDQGTGIYSYTGQVIMPRRSRVMAFEKGGEETVFTRHVKGQKPQHYMYRSYLQTKLYAQARIMSFGHEVLRSEIH